MNYFFQNNDYQLIKLVLIIGWIIIWSTISFNPEKILLIMNLNFLQNLSFSKIELFNLVDIFRGSLSLLYSPIILLIFFFSIKKKLIDNYYSFFTLFLIIFLIQVFSTLLSNNSNLNSYFLINSILSILILLVSKNIFSEKEFFYLTTTSLFILTLVFIFSFSLYIYQFYLSPDLSFYSVYISINLNQIHELPRPTGLSRTGLIIFIFISNYLIFIKRRNLLLMSLMIICSSSIILLSSRTTIFIYVIYITFISYYYHDKKVNNYFQNLNKFIIFPLILIICIIGTRHLIIKNDLIKDLNLKNTPSGLNILRNYPDLKKKKKSDFSSGRIDDWKKIYKKNSKIFFGNGVMGDRYLINQSASNGIAYTYASSGIFGVLLFITLSLISFYYAVKKIIQSKEKNVNFFEVSSSFIILALLARSILETSYAIFSIDFLIFCLCFSNIAYTRQR